MRCPPKFEKHCFQDQAKADGGVARLCYQVDSVLEVIFASFLIWRDLDRILSDYSAEPLGADPRASLVDFHFSSKELAVESKIEALCLILYVERPVCVGEEV